MPAATWTRCLSSSEVTSKLQSPNSQVRQTIQSYPSRQKFSAGKFVLNKEKENHRMGKEIALPMVGMVMAECAQVGLMIMGKVAMSHGMSNFIFVFYSNALASLILLPSSFLFHRYSSLPFFLSLCNTRNTISFDFYLFDRSERPPLTFSILCWFFLLGLLGYVR